MNVLNNALTAAGEEDDRASKDARHLQKAQDDRDVDPLIALISGEGIPLATLISRFSEDKFLALICGLLIEYETRL